MGESFKLLSVIFDTKLTMDEAVHSFASEAGWRMRALVCAKRFLPGARFGKVFQMPYIVFYRRHHGCHLPCLTFNVETNRRLDDFFLERVRSLPICSPFGFQFSPFRHAQRYRNVGPTLQSCLGNCTQTHSNGEKNKKSK